MQLNLIKQMELQARYNPEIISLSQGIPFRNTDVKIRSTVEKALAQNKVDAYSDPQGILSLREAISASLQQEGMEYVPDEILVTAGVTEGLTATFLTILTSEKNEVIIPTPTYAAYFKIVKIAKGKAVEVPLDESKEWDGDRELIEKKVSKRTAAILLCNPNNPTGSLYSRSFLLQICKLAQQYNFMVIIDEVYKNILFDDVDFYSPATEKSYKSNIIRLVSFSKDFAMSGWRVGFLHTKRSVIKKILAVHDSLINCAPVISQYAAISALENQENIFFENKILYTRKRSLMQSYLDDLPNEFSYRLPKGSYFFFPRLLKQKDAELFCKELLFNAHVAVVPGECFGKGGEKHIRLCFGREDDAIRKGMERFIRYVKGMR